jgi:hypothetical protein
MKKTKGDAMMGKTKQTEKIAEVNDQIVETVSPLIWKIGRAMNPAFGEDLFHETWKEILTKGLLQKWDPKGPGTLGTFLAPYIRGVISTHFNKENFSCRVDIIEEQEDDEPVPGSITLDQLSELCQETEDMDEGWAEKAIEELRRAGDYEAAMLAEKIIEGEPISSISAQYGWGHGKTQKVMDRLRQVVMMYI